MTLKAIMYLQIILYSTILLNSYAYSMENTSEDNCLARRQANAKLLEASREGDLDEVKRLVAQGVADINAVFNYYDGNMQQGTPLMIATRYNNIDMVKFLIASKADIDMTDGSDITALHTACDLKKTAIAKVLIDAGANIHCMSKHGLIPLIAAIYTENNELIDILNEAGAHLNIQDANLCTPLMRACKMNGLVLAKHFIKAGANLDMQDIHGHTVLMHVCINHTRVVWYDLVSDLVNAGANIHITDKDGNTALLWAVKEYNFHAVDLLVKAAADINACTKEGKNALALAIQSPQLHVYTDNDYKKLLCLINPTIEKNIKNLLMMYNMGSWLSILPKEVFKIILTCAYPECDTVRPYRQMLVDTVSIETLSALIKSGKLKRPIIIRAWKSKLKRIGKQLKLSKTLPDHNIQTFVNNIFIKALQYSL